MLQRDKMWYYKIDRKMKVFEVVDYTCNTPQNEF